MKKAIKKLFPTFITSIPHHARWLQNSLKLTMGIIIAGTLFINIVLSQQISPFYFQMVNDDEHGVTNYLQSIRQQPAFVRELAKWKTVYGDGLVNMVYDEELRRVSSIQNFEQILNKNPSSRDVLYSLYVLYNQNGNQQKAQEYLGRAKEIDPTIRE